MPPTRPLRPVNPDNVSSLRITAAAGTELAGASSCGTVNPPGCCAGSPSSHMTELYDPKAFITHAALLRQAFAHCAIFPTAASRRSLGRVSVPMWPYTLSSRLPVVALVSRYLTNKLIGREPLLKRKLACRGSLSSGLHANSGSHPVLAPISRGYPQLQGRLLTCYAPVRHSTRPPKGTFSYDLHV